MYVIRKQEKADFTTISENFWTRFAKKQMDINWFESQLSN